MHLTFFKKARRVSKVCNVYFIRAFHFLNTSDHTDFLYSKFLGMPKLVVCITF